MSVHVQEADATRQNIAMAASGFIMAGAIIGAGIAGMVVGRQLAPVASTPSALVAPASSMGQAAAAARVGQAAAAPLAITIKGDPSRPGVYYFSPGAITVHAGQKVTLAISNPGTAMHGIAIPEFGINSMIQPAAHGQATVAQVSFTPTKAGTYLARCIIYCGPGHAQMLLRITVL